LVDPGISLAAEVGRLFAAAPVRPRDTAREARARALPRILVLVALAAIIVVFRPRLPPDRRLLLWLLAGVPALLFAIDGVLAVHRTLSERYALSETLPDPPWREFENAALQAQRDGRAGAARAAWNRAMESGSLRGPVEYQMGLAARAAGDNATARADFQRALAEDPPAPGAGKELAAMALAEGKPQEARRLLEDYLRAAGPDPETLSALAVALANTGDNEASVRTIAAARALVPEDTRRAELESQVYARAGNATAAVAALRPLEARGRLDRSALRSDPAYLPIATDPVWIAFLAETPSAPGPVKRAPSASTPRTTPPA
jgi:tetratricopeptide (TPR) repeat protein